MRSTAERALYSAMRERAPHAYCPSIGRQGVGDIMDSLGINQKQGYSWIDKWCGKGWWDYGVSLPCGWFTPSAPGDLQP